ncbi:hypothetical protein LCGC14_2912030 [marine sediment metagenome]|uniref:Uncharacterized protein n=1 Tax=marine sediment metagenome TaxID=412755 RepID=A0A0F8YD40_9ZZZZ
MPDFEKEILDVLALLKQAETRLLKLVQPVKEEGKCQETM